VHEYSQALLKLLQALATNVRTVVLPQYASELHDRIQNDRLLYDAESWFRLLDELRDALAGEVSEYAQSIFALEGQRHTETFVSQVQQLLGVDVAAIVREEDLGGILADANERNTALIKSLADETVAHVKREVFDAKLNATSARQLQSKLTERFGIQGRRARIIARDQLSKLNSDFNEARHTQAGLKEYQWWSSKDENVRPLHVSLHGMVFQYGKPTRAEGGLSPGKPILCRCIARGIVNFVSEPAAELLTPPGAAVGASKIPAALAKPVPKPIKPVVSPVVPRLDESYLKLQEEARAKYLASKPAGLDPEKINSHVDKVLKTVADPDTRVYMRIYERNFEKVVKGDGRFKSQFETNKSAGLFDKDFRDNTERALFNAPKKMPPKERPIYGYLANKDNIHRENPDLNHYGGVVVRMKPEMRERSTWLLGDSLDLAKTWRTENGVNIRLANGSPVNAPTRTSIAPTKWGRLDSAKGDLLQEGAQYAEAQMWGGVSLDDVEHVVFNPKKPPSSEVIELLKRKNITWSIK
jgi:SPP1 gp7 family putative phage head morphogenesis protein